MLPRAYVLPAVLLAGLLAAPLAGAQGVLRCIEPGGKVLYTNGECPPGSKPERKVETRETVRVLPDPNRPAPPPVRVPDGVPPANAPPAAGAPLPPTSAVPAPATGPVILDGRNLQPETEADRWNTERGGDPALAADGYAYDNGYGYGYGSPPPGWRPPRPPVVDMRAPITGCNASGCQDALGNNFNQRGQVTRYQSIDGKNCRLVGTTQVCR